MIHYLRQHTRYFFVLLTLVASCFLSVNNIAQADSAIPTLLSPLNGALISDRTPVFDWADSVGAVRYNLMVDEDPAFGSPRFNVYPIASAYTSTLVPLADGTWYWQVRARDAVGNWSDWSDTWSMTVDTIRPAPPALLSPANDETSHDNQPIFQWAAVADANNYEIQLDTNQYFNSANLIYGAPNIAQFTPGSALTDQPWYWRVRALDAAGNSGAWSAIWRVYVDAVSTPVPTLMAPADTTLTHDRTPLFDWSDEAGVVRYNIVVDDDPGFGSPRFSVYPVVSAYTPLVTPLADGVWYWQVRALGADGNWSDFSTFWSLTVDATRPGSPNLIDPANGSTIDNNMPAFTWTGPGDGASYRIQVDVSPYFRSASLVEGYANTTQWTPDAAFVDGQWYWHVQALDAAGNVGAWSLTFNVFINAVETPVPILIAPDDDLLTRDRVFTFDWTDEVGVKRYNLQVNSAEDFSGVMRINASPVASEFRNSAIPLNNGVWYWRVCAQGTDNIWGNWSDVRMLKVDLIRPAHPVLTTPALHEMLDTSTPTFGWLPSDADVVEYVLQIDKNIYFRSVDLKQYTGITTTPYAIPDPLEDGPWFWRVAAIDAAGNVSFWSGNSRLVVNAIETPVPRLIAPTDGLLIASPTYLFDWTDEEGVDLYNIEVYSSPDFTFGKRVNAKPTTSEFFNSPRPLFSEVWYWRVRARGTDGIWGDYSESRILRVDLLKPARPTLVSPVNSAISADNTPAFTWNRVPDEDVVGYIIQIDKNLYFSSAERIEQQVTGTSYTPGTALSDQRWFWRVRAVDEAGNFGPWSAVLNVIIDTGTPTSDAGTWTNNLTREQLIELWKERKRR